MSEILDELQWRGWVPVAQTTDDEGPRCARHSRRGRSRSIAVSPPDGPHCTSATSSNSSRSAWRFQRAGHKVICLVGGSTGLIGDPKPTSERVLKTTAEQTAANVARIKSLVQPFLDFDGDVGWLSRGDGRRGSLDWTARRYRS